jgi:hypothetical protein
VSKWSTPPSTLGSLRTELRTVEDRVKSALIDLLNRGTYYQSKRVLSSVAHFFCLYPCVFVEYSDFIALSQSLVGTHEQIMALTQLLSEARAPLSTASDALTTNRRNVDATVARRHEATQRRATLQRLADICEAVQRIQSLLATCQSVSVSPSPSATTLVASSSSSKTDSKRLAVSASIESINSSTPSVSSSVAAASEDPFTTYQSLLDEEPDLSLLDMSVPPRIPSIATAPTPPSSVGTAITPSSTTIVTAVRSNAVVLERVARQLTSLYTMITSDSERWHLVRDQRSAIRALETEFERQLSSTLLQALNNQLMDQVEQCLRAYSFADRCNVAEVLVREKIVRPFVVTEITKDKFTLPPTPAPSTIPTGGARKEEKDHKNDAPENGLAVIYSNILNFVRTRLSPLLNIGNASATSPSSNDWPFHFDFLGNSVWAEVADTLTSTLGSTLFQNGIPDLFHRHYSQSWGLLRGLELLLPSHDNAAITRFRDHSSVRSFLSRWNPSIYFNLRYQRLATPLLIAMIKPVADQSPLMELTPPATKGASATTTTPPITSPNTLTLESSRAVWDSLQQCIHDGVWLDELGSRFFKLQLQLLARYAAWTDNALTVSTPTMAPGGNPDNSLTSATPESTASSSSTAIGRDRDRDDRHVLQFLLSVVFDIRWIAASVATSLIPNTTTRFASLMPPSSSSTSTTSSASTSESSATSVLIREAMMESIDRLNKSITPLLDRVSNDIGRRCIGVLEAEVPRIKATYRMTGKAPPTTHSEYTNMILFHLRSLLLDQLRVRVLIQPSDIGRITVAVIGRTSLRFGQLANELLEAVRSTESSLARLNKTRGVATTSGSGDMSDSDKMVLQLALDMNEFARQSRELDVLPSDCRELDRLLEIKQTYRSQLDARWHRVIDKA